MFLPNFSCRGQVESPLIFLGGGPPDQDLVEVKVNAVVWGDVKLDFYEHPDASPSNRRLAFFLAFNTAFYCDKSEIRCMPLMSEITRRREYCSAHFTGHCEFSMGFSGFKCLNLSMRSQAVSEVMICLLTGKNSSFRCTSC